MSDKLTGPPAASHETILPTPHVIAPSINTQAEGNVSAAMNQRYDVKAGRNTGIMQIVCAVFSLTFGIVAIPFSWDFVALIAWPIWGAVLFYGVAGILGVSTRSRNTRVIVAYMVWSILAALSGAGQVVMETIGGIIASADNEPWNDLGVSVAMHWLAAVVGGVEMIVAITAANICCGGLCGSACFCPPMPPEQLSMQYTTTPASQASPPPYDPPPYHRDIQHTESTLRQHG